MLSKTLEELVFVVRKTRCRCIVVVAKIEADVFTTLEDYILDPDYEVDLGGAHARRKLGCDHEDQP